MSLPLLLGTLAVASADSISARVPIRPALPTDPFAAILNAFKTHNIVALDEGAQGNEQGHTSGYR